MSDKAIRAALETRLVALAGGIPKAQTQFGNKTFAPTAGQPYQRVWLLPAPPHDYGALSGAKRLSGIFQVDLCFPYGEGTGDADDAAEALKGWFAKGLSVTANNVTTRVDRTPEVKTGRVEGDRWVIPIRVTYFANI